MKTDVVTAIIAAIAGVAISFIITSNLIMKDPTPVQVKTLDNSVNTSLSEPNAEVFNYRAVNPTVEAYVDCLNYDLTGNCLGAQTSDSSSETAPTDTMEESQGE